MKPLLYTDEELLVMKRLFAPGFCPNAEWSDFKRVQTAAIERALKEDKPAEPRDGRGCMECEYRDLGVLEEPCKSCDVFSNWEPEKCKQCEHLKALLRRARVWLSDSPRLAADIDQALEE